MNYLFSNLFRAEVLVNSISRPCRNSARPLRSGASEFLWGRSGAFGSRALYGVRRIVL